MPRWDKTSEEWAAFVEDIRAHGIRHPIQVAAGDGLVIDGWTRVLAARDLQLPEIEAEEVQPNEAAQVILREMCLRRNLTKGQRAYLAWPLVGQWIEERAYTRIVELQKAVVGSGLQKSGHSVTTFSDPNRARALLAQTIGVSEGLLEYARELHEIFSGERRKVSLVKLTRPAAEIRAEWEPKILDWDKPIGLGAALAGIAGQEATEAKPRGVNPATQIELFERAVEQLHTTFQATRWQRTPQPLRERILADLRRRAAAWPRDLREQIADALLHADQAEPEPAVADSEPPPDPAAPAAPAETDFAPSEP
jgi:hypothetical protein